MFAHRPAIAHANSTMSAFAEGYKSDTWHQELHRHYWTVPPSNKFYIVTMNNTFMKQDRIVSSLTLDNHCSLHAFDKEITWNSNYSTLLRNIKDLHSATHGRSKNHGHSSWSSRQNFSHPDSTCFNTWSLQLKKKDGQLLQRTMAYIFGPFTSFTSTRHLNSKRQ